MMLEPQQEIFFKHCDVLPFIEMRRADRSSACYHTHSHDEFSFGVIDAGQAEYQNSGNRHAIGAGVTVLINPGDAHACNPRAGNWSYRMLFVDTDWIGLLQQEMLGDKGLDYTPFSNHYHTRSYADFSRLFQCLLNENNLLVAESLLIQFLQPYFLSENSAYAEKLDLHRVKAVKELIMDRLDSNISLDEFSQHCGMSRYHLIRSFKQAYGQSPHAFQLDQRIIKAKHLLREGKTASDTANSLGFADQSHFQRHFKKRLAVTPGQYQYFFV
ncbi:MAG: AraC family transcriptional regulator [Amphritea sp.]